MTGIKSVFQKFLSSSRRRATLSQSLLSNFAQIIDAAYGFVVIPLSITYVGLDTYGWWLISFGIIQQKVWEWQRKRKEAKRAEKRLRRKK